MCKQMILITIDDEGISVEGQGFEGHGCVAEVAKVTRKLGVRGQLEKKPEYHLHQNGKSNHQQTLDQR